jgi:hypothetical protein
MPSIGVSPRGRTHWSAGIRPGDNTDQIAAISLPKTIASVGRTAMLSPPVMQNTPPRRGSAAPHSATVAACLVDGG